MPRLTIAIPTYNRKEYLGEAIRSILLQSFQDFQIIIFDNASDYDVGKYLLEFKDSRISLISNEKNIGNLQNLVRIFDYPFGTPYLMVFHDDDVMNPSLLKKEIAMLDVDDKLAWVNCVVNFVHNNSIMWNFVACDNRLETVSGDVLARWLLSRPIHLSFDGAMYRTDRLKSLQPYVDRFFKWCDRPFLVDLAEGFSVGILHDKLVNYRMHPGQDSKAEAKERLYNIFELQKYYKEKLPQPLSISDEIVFYKSSTNAMIMAGTSFADNMLEYRLFIDKCMENNIFCWKYLNARGVYYIFKVFKHYLCKKD
jgi:glycosyltransferase involved in cell wall biosynthesis